METSGRVGNEKLLIIFPAAVLVFVTVFVTGGPSQFFRLLNSELGKLFDVISAWAGTWLP